MITLKAKINILSGDDSKLQLGSDNLSGLDFSSDLSSVVGVNYEGENPFMFDVSEFGDGSTFSDGVDYYIDKELVGGKENKLVYISEDGNEQATSLIFTIKSDVTFSSVTIAFDKIKKRHPLFINVDGETYTDDDAIFTVAGLQEKTEHEIKIDTWNAEGYPLVITGIYINVDIQIDKRNMLSIECNTADRADFKLPSFGIISNTARIEFVDRDGEISDYAEKLLLVKGLPCKITLENTLVDGAKETIGVYETAEWQYDNDSRPVSVTLKDELEEWQEINFNGIEYDPRKPQEKTFGSLYQTLWKATSNRYFALLDKKGEGNYNMLAPDELDEVTQSVLINTYVQYPLLESGNLWQQWTKLCQACQLHIYKDKNGVIVCRYNGGN